MHSMHSKKGVKHYPGENSITTIERAVKTTISYIKV